MRTVQISKEIIEIRNNLFLGYGNIKSLYWFVGMEEGFNGDQDNLEKRFAAAHKKETLDIQNDMRDVSDHIIWFKENPKIQPTWQKLIYILLVLENERDENVINKEIIRKYQKERLGRVDSNHCLMELMALPCKSVNEKDWQYKDYINSRKEYYHKIFPLRKELFINKINKYKPLLVIFYSFSLLDKWKEIIGANLQNIGGIYFIKKDTTNYFVIPHPTAHGYSKNDWLGIAKKIKMLVFN